SPNLASDLEKLFDAEFLLSRGEALQVHREAHQDAQSLDMRVGIVQVATRLLRIAGQHERLDHVQRSLYQPITERKLPLFWEALSSLQSPPRQIISLIDDLESIRHF